MVAGGEEFGALEREERSVREVADGEVADDDVLGEVGVDDWGAGFGEGFGGGEDARVVGFDYLAGFLADAEDGDVAVVVGVGG